MIRDKFKLGTIITMALILLSFSTEAQWNQLGIDIDGEGVADQSGKSVSLSEDGLTIAIGALYNSGTGTNAGHVRVYKYLAGAWTQQGDDIDGIAGEETGSAVSLSADGLTVAIGSPYNSEAYSLSGQVRVYTFIDGTWTQQGDDINGGAINDLFGLSLCLSSDGLTVAIGSYFNGYVSAYKLIGGAWIQQGVAIPQEAIDDASGFSCDLSADGSILAIGAPRNDGADAAIPDAGHVRVYELISGTWVQQGADIDGVGSGHQSGHSISLSADGLTVAVGAPYSDVVVAGAGEVRIYKFISGVWTQQGTEIVGDTEGEFTGFSVSISTDGLTVAVGAPYIASASGQAKVHKFIAGIWVQQGSGIDGEAAGDLFGISTSLSGDGNIVAAGATENDGNGSNSGHVRVFTTIDGVGLDDLVENGSITVFPNPTKGSFNVVFENAISQVSVGVFSLLGQEIFHQDGINENITIDLTSFQDGIYIIKIKSGEHTITRRVSKL